MHTFEKDKNRKKKSILHVLMKFKFLNWTFKRYVEFEHIKANPVFKQSNDDVGSQSQTSVTGASLHIFVMNLSSLSKRTGFLKITWFFSLRKVASYDKVKIQNYRLP